MYITQEELAGFDTYKYSSVDTSPLSNYIMHPFWNQFVKLFPKWVAPNLMTFSGFLLLVLQTVVLIWYDPYWLASASEYPEYPPIPTWVWWLCCFTQFFSHTLDGIDGKQARRTGSSSPMGELFDHGIDSWCVSMFAFGIFSIFGRGEYGTPAWQFYSIQWMLMTCFLLSHWEKYNTGILYLPWSYDLSQVAMAIAYMLAAIFGTDMWSGELYGLKYKMYVLFALYGSGIVYSIPVSFHNVYKLRTTQGLTLTASIFSRHGKILSYASKTGKMRSTYEAIVPLISPCVGFAITTTWAIWSPGDILNQYPRWFLATVGTILSNIICRLIVSQMSSCRCQVLNFLLLPLLMVAAVSVFLQNAVIEALLLKLLTVSVVLLHVHYGVLVVDQLADHLGIKVFSIKKPDKKHGD